jgi:hypothetical protein
VSRFARLRPDHGLGSGGSPGPGRGGGTFPVGFGCPRSFLPGLLCCWPRTLTEAPAGAARPIRFPALALVFAGDRLHPSAVTAARMRSRNSGDSTGTAGATRREGPDAVPGPAAAQATKASWQGNPSMDAESQLRPA